MSRKTADDRRRHLTAMARITTIEEIPVLTKEDRKDLQTALEEARASIERGEATVYDRKTFKDGLLAIYRGGK